MNTLVEKMFGIIMFLAIFVPFQIGLYTSYMEAWEFTQVTTEFTQLIKEEGKYTVNGSASKFYGDVDDLDNIKSTKTNPVKESPYDLQSLGYRVHVTNLTTGAKSYNLPASLNITKEKYETMKKAPNGQAYTDYNKALAKFYVDNPSKGVDAKFGDVIQIKYVKNINGVTYKQEDSSNFGSKFSWKPSLEKVTNVTVYKR